MLKVLCQNYICPYPKHFAPTNYLHTFEVFNIQNFCCFIHIYLYIYEHWKANLTSCTHLHLKRNFHAIYIYLRGNSTSYIHLGSILVPFLTWVHFLKSSLCYLSTNINILKGIFTLPIHKYTYFERHFLLFIHTLQGIFYAIYIHIYTYR